MIICETCMRGFDGSRSEARRAAWEPESIKTQWALDHGPMVCPACIRQLLDDVLRAMRASGGMS